MLTFLKMNNWNMICFTVFICGCELIQESYIKNILRTKMNVCYKIIK